MNCKRKKGTDRAGNIADALQKARSVVPSGRGASIVPCQPPWPVDTGQYVLNSSEVMLSGRRPKKLATRRALGSNYRWFSFIVHAISSPQLLWLTVDRTWPVRMDSCGMLPWGRRSALAHQWLRFFQCLLAMPQVVFSQLRLWLLVTQALWACSPQQREVKAARLC